MQSFYFKNKIYIILSAIRVTLLRYKFVKENNHLLQALKTMIKSQKKQ